MSRSILGKMLRVALALSALCSPLVASWVGYAGYLAAREDRACGQPLRTVADGDRELQRVLDEHSAADGEVGLQATVVFSDGTQWSAVSGYASRREACPLTPEHHLYVGSLTKLYVAAAVMQQVEEGTIALDDKLDRWVDLPYADRVTVRMLLNHTSGIPNYTENLWFALLYRFLPWKEWQSDELVGLIRPLSLKFVPGSRYEYSSSNYVLLVEILEAATGRSFDDILHADLLSQFGLQDTYFIAYPDNLPIANGYDRSLMGLGPLSFGTRNVTGFRGSLSGVILSTSNDVARFVHALFSGEIVSSSTVDQMKQFVEVSASDFPEQTGYGLGVARLEIDGQELIGHSGSSLGYSGMALYDEENRHTIVILSNLSNMEATRLVNEIQDVILKH